MKIGVMFGSPETTYRRQCAQVLRIGASRYPPHWRDSRRADEVIGNETRVKVVKNKLAPPFKQVEFDILYGTGISREGELIDLGVKHGMVEKAGAWYSYRGDRIGQGRDNVRNFLKEHEDVAASVDRALRERLLGTEEAETKDPEEVEA